MTVRAVHHVNCATMCPVAGYLLGAKASRGRMIAHVLMIETERDGLVIVDTGLGSQDVTDKVRLPRAFVSLVGPTLDSSEPAIAQVAALGFSPDDVRHVVVTHLDIDHAGGLPDFPRAQVHVHAREHESAMRRSNLMERARYLPVHWQHGPRWELYQEDGDTWRGLPAITRLRGLDADIGLVPMHGHSRGHSAVIVRVGDRWLVHAGDAYFHRGSVERDGRIPIGFEVFQRLDQYDNGSRRASLAALRQLRAHNADVELFCAHDEREFAAMRGRA